MSLPLGIGCGIVISIYYYKQMNTNVNELKAKGISALAKGKIEQLRSKGLSDEEIVQSQIDWSIKFKKFIPLIGILICILLSFLPI